MKIKKEKQIENLVKNGVIIATQEYLVHDNGGIQKLGEIERISYGNWESDRERLVANEPVDIARAVMAIWGDEPTIAEPTQKELEEEL